ncbi:hypothetical protein LCGC14_1747560 [marine sediment metagenome]|uniref:Uncharacterized protein n=1 Tax=marine sediment metagenome TaxID=412755 RepID=A0A0F9JK15_9ZZZZ
MSDKSLEWRLTWTMWPHAYRAPHNTEAIHSDEAAARRQLEGLLSMVAPHELRPCDMHVWSPKLESRPVQRGDWTE